jgi:tetratricopeptide (TPR) repeat protein
LSETSSLSELSVQTAQKAMMAGRLEEATETLSAILAESPEHLDALYAAAVCARYRKSFPAAEAFLNRVFDHAPEYGRAYQELGYLKREMGEHAAALQAFQLATRYNPSLITSWQAQAELLGPQQPAGDHAAAQAQRLQALPREVLAVTNLIAEGKILKAEALCRSFLQKHPRHVEAMRLLADIGMQLGILDDAEFLLESAAEFEPDNIQVRLDYIQVLRKRQKFERALDQAKRLHQSAPDNRLFKSHYAIESMQTGSYDRALTLFDEILADQPDDPLVLTSRGHALKTMGRHDDAIASYRQAITTKPDHGDAWYGLANLKTYSFPADETAVMAREEARGNLTLTDRIHLCFALGKAHEDAKRFDESFACYERGNALKCAQTRYTPEHMDEEFAAQKRFCTRAVLEERSKGGCPAPDPIFIVGLPRAGSTLLEQILASHSKVDGTLELPNILSLAHRLRGRTKLNDRDRYPRILGDMSAKDREKLGSEYIETTRIHRAGAPFFTDKMPNNFRHIGLIKMILPNAKIIDARREPMACCFSGFKQLFAEGQEFTYGLDEIGRYYRGYVDLMDHWDKVLPGEILRVQYEDVVDDLEIQVRRILDFCGLEFESSCVDFHETDRAVRTASSEQVRQPINSAGLEQWRHFEAHLNPLKDALGPALTEYRRDRQ